MRKPSLATIAVVVTVAIGVLGNLAAGFLHVPARHQAWVWLGLGVLTVVAILTEMFHTRRPDQVPIEDVDSAVALFARSVHAQWVQEAVLRRIRQPMPVRVRWSSTGRPVAAAREVVLDQPGGDGWEKLPLSGDVHLVVKAFRGLPHRQLVVLGGPGAGKSVLAMLLTLGLVEHPEPGVATVPVLLSITSWNPTVERLEVFLARRLREEYPFLGHRNGDGRNLAERLVSEKRVVAVLDGLDEVPADLHAESVEALDRFAAAGRPFLVTCRSREYEHAVVNTGTVLSRAAVVEIEPVDTEAALDFLAHPATARQRWQPVFAHLRAAPAGPLARALATPLMVSLARTAYTHPGTDPAELTRLDDQRAVEARLIEGFVSSLYRGDQPGEGEGSGATQRAYDPEKATRWLRFLSFHLYRAGTRDLLWWQVNPALMARNPAYGDQLVALLATVGAALTGVLAAGPLLSWPAAVAVGLATGVVVGANAYGLLRPLWPDGYPPYVVLQYRPPRMRRLGRIATCLLFGVLAGTLTGVVVDPSWSGVLAGLLGGLLAGLVDVATPRLTVSGRPSRRLSRRPSRRTTPALTMRLNHRNALRATVRHGLIGAAAFAGVALWRDPGPAWRTGAVAAVLFGVAAGLGAGWWTWLRYRAAHAWLALRGWLPWRLSEFLDDGHRRGTFRQNGTAWQFRHALLQDHLARPIHLRKLRRGVESGDRAAVGPLVGLLLADDRAEDAVALLRRLVAAGDRDATARLADVLVSQRRVDEAVTVLRARADRGDWNSARHLIDLLTVHGRLDEAITFLQPRVRTDFTHATGRLADLLAAQGRVEEAIALLTDWIGSGHTHAVGRLVDLLTVRGRVEEAIAVLEPLAGAADVKATGRLVDLLNGSGRTDDAIEFLKSRLGPAEFAAGRLADNSPTGTDLAEGLWALGNNPFQFAARQPADQALHAETKFVAGRLAALLATEGRLTELRALADTGHRVAARHLIDVLAANGGDDELRERARDGDEYAMTVWTAILARDGHFAEVVAVLRKFASPGEGALIHAGLLAEHGRVGEAIEVLRAHDRGRRDRGQDVTVARRLAELLAVNGDVDELRGRANGGDDYAAEQLAQRLADTGEIDEAMAVLRGLADVGHEGAGEQLVELLVHHGRLRELRNRADAGHLYAALRLADALAERNRVEEATAILRVRADAGNAYAARQLVELLLRHHDVEELRARVSSGDDYAAQRLTDLLAAEAVR